MGIDEQAEILQREVNERIAERCTGNSHLVWQAIADAIIDEMGVSDRWEYIWATEIGKPPKIVLTRFNPPREVLEEHQLEGYYRR